MTRKKQTQHIIGAILTRETPAQDPSLITVLEEQRRAYPNVQPKHMQKAVDRCCERQYPEDEPTISWFGIKQKRRKNAPGDGSIKQYNNVFGEAA